MELLLVLFVCAAGFFVGYQLGGRKRLDKLETKIEALEVAAGLRPARKD